MSFTHYPTISNANNFTSAPPQVLPTLEASGVQVFAVGLGSADNAQEFARILRFPANRLYADPSGEAYRVLNFSPGFAPQLDINPYAKLVPMLAGIGSPGTLQEVCVHRVCLGSHICSPIGRALGVSHTNLT